MLIIEQELNSSSRVQLFQFSATETRDDRREKYAGNQVEKCRLSRLHQIECDMGDRQAKEIGDHRLNVVNRPTMVMRSIEDLAEGQENTLDDKRKLQSDPSGGIG